MSGSLFDIVGPIMVGPSSSHTAGAVRLACLARLIAGRPILSVEFVLYNSFAQTYRGHGTDRGLLAGMLGMDVNDDGIRDAFELAKSAKLDYKFTPFTGHNNYSPNTVVFNLLLQAENPAAEPEKMTIVGHSVGGGKVYVSRINDYNVSLKGEAPTVIMFYKDQPGMIWRVTKIIAENHINIAGLQCSRLQRDVEAFMSIALDTQLPDAAKDEINHMTDVYLVRTLDALPS